MHVGGYLDGEISRSQATKKMKAAGYQYGQPDFWAEWNDCYVRSEEGFLFEKREPKRKVPAAMSDDLPKVGAHLRRSPLEGGFHTGSPDVT